MLKSSNGTVVLLAAELDPFLVPGEFVLEVHDRLVAFPFGIALDQRQEVAQCGAKKPLPAFSNSGSGRAVA